MAPMTAFFEFACGLLLLIGLATRVASLPIIVIMIVALATAKKDDIHELSDLLGQSEYLYICLALWLGAYGAGPLSADYLIARRMEAGERPVTVH
jgi:putative oxidoreductase